MAIARYQKQELKPASSRTASSGLNEFDQLLVIEPPRVLHMQNDELDARKLEHQIRQDIDSN